MINNSTLIDNSSADLQMAPIINELIHTLTDNPDKSKTRYVKIATGYWDIPGTALLLASLTRFLQDENTKFQLLIGTDPVVRAAQLRNPKYKGAQCQQDFIRCDLEHLEVRDEYISVIHFLKQHCLSDFDASRIQVKMCHTNSEGEEQFFHAKCYIFLGNQFTKGIIGSSNFTQKGLEGNSELNYLEWDNVKVMAKPDEFNSAKGHNCWFEERWGEADEWNNTFLEEVLKGTPIDLAQPSVVNSPLTPYELYIKLLHHKFGAIVDLDQQQLLESYLPSTYQALDYQLQAVRQCFSIMHEHGGFMLSDVVGLGKTIVGSLIIKHFLTLPDDNGREHSVLVITPPAIQSSWLDTIHKFDEDRSDKMMPSIDFVTTGSIGKLVDEEDNDIDEEESYTGDFDTKIEYKDYGLILIDESHKFRNNQTAMYKALDSLIGKICETTGNYPYIGLLTATPQNNRPSDLQNQIYLFQRNHSESTLKKADGGNLEGFFSRINRLYAELIAMPKDETGHIIEFTTEERKYRHRKLKELSLTIRNCVLEDILVRRTRTDILKYYGGSGLVFPQISGPHLLEYVMEEGLAQLFAQTMDIIATQLLNDDSDLQSDCLHYYRYRAIEFLVDEDLKTLYQGGNLQADRFSRQLARIMQMNLVKRIESSFTAFKSSLNNLRRYTENMIKMWEADTIFVCPDLNVNAEFDPEKHYAQTGRLSSFTDCATEIRNKIAKLTEKGRNERGRNRELHRSDFRPEYIDCLRQDLTLIDYLCNRWSLYSEDPKLECFKENLRTTLFDPQRNQAQKLIIFSEAVDTVNTIARAIHVVAPKMKVLTVRADNRKELEGVIRENFDANYDGMWKEDYQVLVTTEVLAEGVNLHRANNIVNYDTPWNSTRLMQRIGRVNRIGSTAKFVYVYNFMPSAQGDMQIQLVQKAHTKLQAFHTLFGEDAKVFNDEEEVTHYDLNTQVNGEESPMEKYINELKQYKEAHPERFQQIIEKGEGLELAIPAIEDASYFLVRNPRISGLFVSVNKDLEAHILSGTTMYEAFRPSVEAIATDLPADWEARRKKAVQKVNQSLTRMNLRVVNSQKATQAKGIILVMKNQLPLSRESKAILQSAYDLIKRGNMDIIKKILAIHAEWSTQENRLFTLTQEEVDDLLSREISKIIAPVQDKYGKTDVYLALSK